MNVLASISRSAWVSGFRAVPCSDPTCRRWLTQRALEARPVGITLEEAWFCSFRCASPSIEKKLQALLVLGSRAELGPGMPLGLMLVRRGVLLEDQLREAAQLKQDETCDLGDLLVSLGYVTERQVLSARAAQWGCPVFSPSMDTTAPAVKLPLTLMRHFQMAPMYVSDAGRRVLIGFSRRVEHSALYAIEQQLQCRTHSCIISASDVEDQIAVRATQQERACVEGMTSIQEMTRRLCNEGASIAADRLHLVRCRGYVWARYYAGLETHDVLLPAKAQRRTNPTGAKSDASLIRG